MYEEPKKCMVCARIIFAGDHVLPVLVAGWYQEAARSDGDLIHLKCLTPDKEGQE